MYAYFSHRRSAWIALAGLVLLAVGLSACGGGAVQTMVVTEIVEGKPVEVVVTSGPEESFAGEETSDLFDVSGNSSTSSQQTPLDVLPQDRMIIKNGEITLLVENMDAALGQVSQIAVDNDGYILTSESNSNDYSTWATVTIAVRSEQFETAMRRLRGISLEVQGERVSGQDVSAEYVDLKSRLRNLEATRDRVARLLDQAKTVEEALEVSRQLSDIESEIELIKGRMNFLQGRSAMSTITISLVTPDFAPPTPTPAPWSPSRIVANAVKTQGGLLRGLAGAALWLGIVVLPYGVVIGIVAYGGKRLFWRSARPVMPPPPPHQNQPGTGGDQS